MALNAETTLSDFNQAILERLYRAFAGLDISSLLTSDGKLAKFTRFEALCYCAANPTIDGNWLAAYQTFLNNSEMINLPIYQGISGNIKVTYHTQKTLMEFDKISFSERNTTEASSEPITPESIVNILKNLEENPFIPWYYKYDGCTARAYFAYEFLFASGALPEQMKFCYLYSTQSDLGKNGQRFLMHTVLVLSLPFYDEPMILELDLSPQINLIPFRQWLDEMTSGKSSQVEMMEVREGQKIDLNEGQYLLLQVPVDCFAKAPSPWERSTLRWQKTIEPRDNSKIIDDAVKCMRSKCAAGDSVPYELMCYVNDVVKKRYENHVNAKVPVLQGESDARLLATQGFLAEAGPASPSNPTGSSDAMSTMSNGPG